MARRCENCIHDKVCNMWAVDSGIPFVNADTCEHYKPAADVVPKSEADQWYQEYHLIKDELKREKMEHNATEKLADRYCVELQTAKSEVARDALLDLKRQIHDKAVYPSKSAGISPYISLKAFDAILQNYLNGLK